MNKIVYLSLGSVSWAEAEKKFDVEIIDHAKDPMGFYVLNLLEPIESKELIEKLKTMKLEPNAELMLHECTADTPFVVYLPSEAETAVELLNELKKAKPETTLVSNGLSLNDIAFIDGSATLVGANRCVYTKEDMKEVRDELEYSTDKIAGLEDELEECKNELKDSKKDNEILLDKIKKLEKEIEELEDNNENLHKTIESLEDELDDKKGIITDLEFDIEQRESMIDGYEDEIKELEDELRKLKPDPDNRILVHNGVAYRY